MLYRVLALNNKYFRFYCNEKQYYVQIFKPTQWDKRYFNP